MSNTILSIAGSSHQGYGGFSDISRGTQCSFMSFVALLCAQSCAVQRWTTRTVDQILIERHRMYLDALERQSIPDTDAMSLTYLPDRGRWTITSLVQSPVKANNSEQSPVEAIKNGPLKQRIQNNRRLRNK